MEHPKDFNEVEALLEKVRALEADRDAYKALAKLLEHKVITCGVAASHSDANLAHTGAYAGKWDSPQAIQVRALRAERDALRADAARYQWLAERFTGYDFNWMPSEEGALDGKSCIVIEATEGFRGGRDLGAGIDAAIAAKEPK